MHRFRIATYNIHKCRGVDGRVHPERIARVLEEVNADIVSLQEVVSHEGAAARIIRPIIWPAGWASSARWAKRASIAAGPTET